MSNKAPEAPAHSSSTVSVTAHRGDSGRFRENTLPAIRSAVEAGFDFVEVDVRLTADGQVVLLHDETLLRLWDLDRPVSELTYREIAGLGSGEERIPLLEEALGLFYDCDSTLLIDMEEAAPATSAAAVVRQSGIEVAWCGNLDGMRTIRSLDPGARLWLPWNSRAVPPQDLLDELQPEYVNMEYVVLSRALVEDVHQMGQRVACWTVDDEAAMRWVLGLGVDAVTSNRPRHVRETLDRGPSAWLADPPAGQLTFRELLEVRLTLRELAEWAIEYTRNTERGKTATKVHEADLVTAVDLAVEQHVREVVSARFPGHSFVGEEFGGAPVEGTPCWYLDPVDGTTNFANNIPWTAFSLAVAIDHVPLASVVAHPWRDEIIEAAAGMGARINGQAISIGQYGLNPDSLAGAVVHTELMQHRPWPGMAEFLRLAGDHHATLRIMGSGTLTVAGIALGRGSGAVIAKFNPIDHLAATLIVQEAGGIVLDEDGAVNPFPASGGFLAAAPQVADELYGLWRLAEGTER